MDTDEIKTRLRDLNTKAYYLLIALSFAYWTKPAFSVKLALTLTAFVAVVPMQDRFKSQSAFEVIRWAKVALLTIAFACTFWWLWFASPIGVTPHATPPQSSASADTAPPPRHAATISPAQILLTALGAFLGALLSIVASMAIESQRKPKLHLTIESPPLDRPHPPGAGVAQSRFLRVIVINNPMPKPLQWLGRSAAYHCAGDIEFHHLEDGAPIFSRAMPIRWAGSEEPFQPQGMQDGSVKLVFDMAKYHAAFWRDCYPGTPELVDIAARYDQEEECYGWTTESYLEGRGWRNPEFKLPKGRYLVRVTIRSSGDKLSPVFKLDNSGAREDFRLQPATAEEKARLQPQD